jgi:hypothetical protein
MNPSARMEWVGGAVSAICLLCRKELPAQPFTNQRGWNRHGGRDSHRNGGSVYEHSFLQTRLLIRIRLIFRWTRLRIPKPSPFIGLRQR